MYLAFITHDLGSNTLEAVWMEAVTDADGEVSSYRAAKRRNYSAEQKAEFESDCGAGSEKYTLMAGW